MNEQLKSTLLNIANDITKNEELSNMRILYTKDLLS